MKIKQKLELTFGDLIRAEYEVRETCQAAKMLRDASAACLVVFRALPHYLTSAAKERSV